MKGPLLSLEEQLDYHNDRKEAKVMETRLPLCLGRWSEDKQTQLYNNLRESPEQWHRDVVSESEEAQPMCSHFISIKMPAHVIVTLGTCYCPIWSQKGCHKG